MDSLLANYVSSDEDDDPQQKPTTSPSKPISDQSFSEPASSKTSITTSFFSSLPKPKSSSFFQSLPQPKHLSSLPNPAPPLANPLSKDNNDDLDDEIPRPFSKTSGSVPKLSSILSSLPKPKSQLSEEPISISSSTGSSTKRVVQFKPPVNPYVSKSGKFDDEDEEEDEEKERKRRKGSEFSSQPPSVNSFLSFMPAPRNSSTLGALPSSGSGRRAIVETQVSGSAANSDVSPAETDSSIDQSSISYANYDNFSNHQSGVDQSSADYSSYQSYENYGTATDPNAGNYASYSNHGEYLAGINQSVGVDGQIGGYGSYGDYGQDGNPSWVDASSNAALVPEVSGVSESGIRISGKRRKNDIPTEIVEVKQDELMKDRPREDQVKLTGIAFGPAYKPVSTSGKPTKLHKRKHQIGSLYFDMRQKEMELQERRSKGLLTKAETQAKYGW